MVLLSLLGAVGCGSSPAAPTPTCVLNSECTNGLVCSLGFCVKRCVTSADCPPGNRCVISDVMGGDGGTATACLAPESRSCQYNSQCASPLKCGVDLQCRDQCETKDDCPMDQVCTSMSHLCVDPIVDKAIYDPATNELKPAGSGTGGSGGVGGHGGTAGAPNGDGSTDTPQDIDGAADGGAGGGGGGVVVNKCPSPQTTFGNVAQGDANPKFASSVGARGADKLYIFSGYMGPAPSDGGADAAASTGDQNIIYVQAFDPSSGESLGPAAPLLRVLDNPYFYVRGASVATTGEIVVLHSTGTPADGAQSQLYASFFKSAAADAGASAPLTLVKTVQLESVHLSGTPQAVWSVATQTFDIAWKYMTADWFARVRKFFPDGSSAGGDTNVVPVPRQLNGNLDDGKVGVSGAFVAVGYRSNPDNQPWITILDNQGVAVGDPILLAASPASSWTSVGGTTKGFLGVYDVGSTLNAVFVPLSATGTVVDGGTAAVTDGGAPAFATFALPSMATPGPLLVSDDTGGLGGVAVLSLEPNGASYTYVTADASKHLSAGTVLSSANGGQVGLTNYRGSFGISLYDTTKHSTQMVASGCQP